MTFQLQIDKNSFQFHTICIGMNPLKHDAATRTKEECPYRSRSMAAVTLLEQTL
jgi:hypothetical protein